MEHSLLYLKRSMDGMQRSTQGEVEIARGAIEIERDLSDRRTTGAAPAGSFP